MSESSKSAGVFFAPWPVVALVCWVIPGAGYALFGQLARGLTIGISVLALFVMGMWIGGVRVVDPPPAYRPISRVVFERPWFLGQIFAGPVTLIAARIGSGGEEGDRSSIQNSFQPSHSRSNDIGTLYTAVAGMLNLLAIIDAAHRAAHRGGQP